MEEENSGIWTEPEDRTFGQQSSECRDRQHGWKNGQLTLSVPESSFAELQEALAQATTCPKPVETVESIVSGWLNAFGPALTNADRRGIVGRVIECARDCGFYELQPRTLDEMGKQARKRWLDFSNGEEFAANG